MNSNKLLTTLTSRRTSFRTAFMIIIAFAAMATTTQSAFAHEGFIEICKFGDIDGKDGGVDLVKFS